MLSKELDFKSDGAVSPAEKQLQLELDAAKLEVQTLRQTIKLKRAINIAQENKRRMLEAEVSRLTEGMVQSKLKGIPMIPFQTNAEALKTFYARYNPKKMSEVDTLLSKFSISQLNSALLKRYGGTRAPMLIDNYSPRSSELSTGPTSLPPSPPRSAVKPVDRKGSFKPSPPSTGPPVDREVREALTKRLQEITEQNFGLKQKVKYLEESVQLLQKDLENKKSLVRSMVAKIRTGALYSDEKMNEMSDGMPTISPTADILKQVKKHTKSKAVLDAFHKMEVVLQESVLENVAIKDSLKKMAEEMDRMRLRQEILTEENKTLKKNENAKKSSRTTFDDEDFNPRTLENSSAPLEDTKDIAFNPRSEQSLSVANDVVPPLISPPKQRKTKKKRSKRKKSKTNIGESPKDISRSKKSLEESPKKSQKDLSKYKEILQESLKDLPKPNDNLREPADKSNEEVMNESKKHKEEEDKMDVKE